MGLGLAAAVCAFGTLAAPALAKHKEHPHVLGKFVANYPNGAPISEASPAVATGLGWLEKIELAEGAVTIPEEGCKRIKSSGEVVSERSDTIYQDISFHGCHGITDVGTAKHVKAVAKIPNFSIAMEFHSNGFAETGLGEASSVHIEHAAVHFKAYKGSPCVVVIPSQTIPIKALKKPEGEFEAAEYETEFEEPVKLKKFPAGFQEKLDIDMEFTKVEAYVEPNEKCEVGAGFNGKTGVVDAELEEMTIKNGNLGFRDKEEVEAEEAI